MLNQQQLTNDIQGMILDQRLGLVLPQAMRNNQSAFERGQLQYHGCSYVNRTAGLC